VESTSETELLSLLKKGKKAKFLSEIKPMLCTLIRKPFDNQEFLFEVKLDGYRIIAYVQNGKVTLSSRSYLDYTKKYPSVAEALSELDLEVILDGELVALNDEGKPDFDAFQKNNGKIHWYFMSLIFFDVKVIS